MEISVEINQEDYLNFNKFYYIKKKSKQRYIRTAALSLIIAFATMYGDPIDSVIFCELALLAFVTQFLILRFCMPFMIKLVGHVPAKDGIMLGKKTFRITAEGIEQESENSRVFQKWKAVRSVEENKRSVFIFVDTIAAYIIPKRFFDNEEQVAEFVKVVKGYAENESIITT